MIDSKRIAVITGGGGDMGVACARRLGADHRIILAEVNEKRLGETVAAFREDGVDAIGHPLDITNAASVFELAKHAAAEGELGALVHTAGLSPTMGDAARIWDVNLLGSAHLMEAFRPHVRQGSVAVLIASQAGHFARTAASPELTSLLENPLGADFVDHVCALDPSLATSEGAYGGSKYGVMLMAQREAIPWGAVGGRVISLSPGIIDTGMGQQEFESQPFMKTIVEMTPLQRMGVADEIAKVVTFLCSDAASFVSGSDLLVDGGSTARVEWLMAKAER
jgi:NAD(P)-dependent dehydrogenase (short-subunit alcohol dehydrogenase family)